VPAGFKIAEAYVAVVPKDQDFEAGLRRIVEQAAAGVDAEVGLGLHKDAPEQLKADLDAALFLVTDKLTADVGMGLRNDAVGDLDKDVKAGIALVEDDNKIKVKVDPKAASSAGQQAGGGFGKAFAIGAGAILGSPILAEAALAGIPLMLTAVGGYFLAHSPDVQRSFATFKKDISGEMTAAVAPLAPAAQDALSQLDTLFRNETPRLGGYFVALGPDLNILTGGVKDLITNVLPGFDAAMAVSQPTTAAFAQGLGLAGDGVAKLIEGLAGGAQGGAQGFVAVMTLLDHLLGIIGTDFGRLANSAGPLLTTLEPILSAVASDLLGMTTSGIISGLDMVNSILSALPVDVVRALADATAAWYASSKVYGLLAGLGPLAATAAEKVGLLATAEGESALSSDAMGAALGKGLGIIGLVVTAAGFLGDELGKLSGVGDHTAANVDDLTSSMIKAAQGSTSAQGGLNQFALTMSSIGGFTGSATDGMKSLDDALVKLFQLNPAQAATEYRLLAAAMEAQGISAADVAKDLPGYTQATKDAALAAQEHATALGGTTPLMQQFTQSVQDAVNAVTGETTDIQSLTQAFDALDGVNITATQDQIRFRDTVYSLTTAVKTNGATLDQNTDSGRKNMTIVLQAADAADKHAEAVYKQTGSIQKADAAFIADRDQLDATMKKLHFTTDQINAMNTAFFNVPNIKPQVNTDPAMAQMAALDSFIMGEIANMNGSAVVTPSVSGASAGRRAEGGPVVAGRPYVVGEKRRELFVPDSDGYVYPSVEQGQRALAAGSSGGGGVTIQNLTIPITMTGFADFTDPNSMTVTARKMAVNISNALVQVRRSGTGGLTG
jgi:hypothetical protein